jgi:manganese transport protein
MPPPVLDLADPGPPLAIGAIPRPAQRRPILEVIRRVGAFAGPGYLVAVGYMDPGNWATDIAGGARFGYALLPAVLVSGLAAMVLQCLSLRLGIATGRDLAQLCRERYGRWTVRGLWATCEIAIIACDLAEVLGAAIALKLLFHLPLAVGVAVTAFDTLLILGLQRRGFRFVEALVITLTAVIGGCIGYELVLSHPDIHGVVASLVPTPALLHDRQALYLALAIFGATVMPHNLYLHSSIAQSRVTEPGVRARRRCIRFSTFDCLSALAVALAVNCAILILAGAAFHVSGHVGVADLESASALLSPLLGAAAASVLFAVALLAAGQNSTITGTMAGQIVMEGFLGLTMKPHIRRMITRGLAVAPALGVVLLFGDHAATQLLIFSQVVLSLQLGFAVVPLVQFTTEPRLMGPFVSGRLLAGVSYVLAGAIVVVNLWLVAQALGWTA